MTPNSHAIIIGGIYNEAYGRAIGPYRIRTSAEQAGFTCSVVDFIAGVTERELISILDKLVGSSTVVLGISYTWFSAKGFQQEANQPSMPYIYTAQFLQKLQQRYPLANIVLGSNNSSKIPSDVLSFADWVVSGFSELSFPELLKHLTDQPNKLKYSNRTVKGNKIHFIDGNIDYVVQDMSLLQTVFHPYDDYKSHQPLTLEVSRGCLFKCAFCSYPFLGKKTFDYVREEDDLARELRTHYDMFGTTRYLIADDTFNDSMEKIDRLRRAVDKARLPNFEFVAYIRGELLALKPDMIPALHDLGIRGAFFGIESLNNTARKAINRVTDINKVLDAISKFKSTGNVATQASLIAGLPGDTLEEVSSWGERLVKNKKHWFDSWQIVPLLIIKNSIGQPINFDKTISSRENKSSIEANPEKYGYTFEDDTHVVDYISHWKNKDMTFKQAQKVCDQMFQQTLPSLTCGGWDVGAAWYFGFSDHEIQTMPLKNLNMIKRGRMMSYNRARSVLSRLNVSS